jgi:hypothetical protein
MSVTKTIRYNSIFKSWEHWVDDSAYIDGGHWAFGVIGNDTLVATDIINSNIATYDNIIDSVDGMKYEDYIISLYKSVPNSANFSFFNVTEFSELIDISNYNPIIESINIDTLFTDANDINILIDSNVDFVIIATNPWYENDTGLIYKWVIGEDTYTNITKFLNLVVSASNAGVASATISNKTGSTESKKYNIIVHNPAKLAKFNTNLIQNQLTSWDVINGSPEEMAFWIKDNATATRAALFNYNGVDLALTNAIDDKYIVGGNVNINSVVPTILMQEIDLSGFSDYIDKTIYGVDNTSILLYGYIGTWGDNKGYIGEVTPYGVNGIQLHGIYKEKINYSIQNLIIGDFYSGRHIDTTEGFSAINKDYVLIDFNLLDSANIVLSTIQFKSTEHDSEMKFYLNSAYIPVPIGTTKLQITCKFIKSNETLQYYNYRWWEDYGTSPVYSGITNLETAYKHDHLSSIYGLTAKLDINYKYLSDTKAILNI